MAKTVSDLKIKVGLQGAESFAKLKSAFRGLEKTVGVTDKGIQELRKGLLEYTSESNGSIKVIRGQIGALQELRQQALIGGRVFRQLSRDIEGFERQLQQAEQQASRTQRAISFRGTGTTFIARQPGALLGRIGARQQATDLETEPYTARGQLNTAYISQQGELNTLRTVATRIEERYTLAIRAANRATVDNNNQNLTAAEIMQRFGGELNQSATTTAQLSQRLREAREDLLDITAGTREYGRALGEIRQLERQIADPFGTAARKEQIRGRLGAQATFGMYADNDPVAKAIRRRERRAARRAGPRQVPAQVQEISGLYQQITDIGMARTRGYIDAMGKSYKEVTEDIRKATAASNGSINSLNSQKAAWTTLRNSLNPASVAYKEVSREIDAVDKKLTRLNRTRGRLGRNLAAGAGGLLSGGIFGGPEGALGGLAGGLLGGPGGALAGAAVGAQLSQVRQQLGGVAEFNAQITLAKTTLAQASTGLKDYTRLLNLARRVSSDYSVSLQPAISGLAQIATAARANNLSFEDTEKIYRGLIASNVAFGKSQEDLDAIIRATVQVLSKGKVSAEELSGQIGERLPGAVAKFAAANKMTLPQLTKAFKDGEVTIAQFVRFAAAQGEEYGEIAQKIAEGPEKAGIRLQIALENSAEIFGSFFAKAGAGFQDFFTKIVTFFNNNEKRVKQFVTNMVNSAVLIAGIIKNIVMGIVNFAKGALDILEKFNPLIKAVRLSFQKGLQDFYEKAPDMLKGAADKFGIKLYSVEDLFPDKGPTSFGKGGGTAGTPDGGTEGGTETGRQRILMTREELALRDRIREAVFKQKDLEKILAEYRLDAYKATLETEDPLKRQNMLRDAISKFEQKILKYRSDQLKKQEEANKKQEELLKKERDFNAELVDRQYQLGIITEQEYNRLLIERERARLKEAYPDISEGKREEMVELKRREVDPTFAEGLQTQIANLKRELKELTDPVNALVNGATAIGNAFSNSFINVISGSQSAKEALADFFKNIGNYFLDLASQIISKMIVIAALNAIAQILPVAGAGGKKDIPKIPGAVGEATTTGITTPAGNLSDMLSGVAAEGAYWQGGFNAFANGGVVRKPTLGLIGEGGEPEYIIPASKMRGAMKRYSAGARGSGVIPANGEQGAPTLGGAGFEGGPIDVRYTVERINSVDYVTADQFRTGMSEAAQRGAVQGEQRTLRRLQMSTSTRKRLGM